MVTKVEPKLWDSNVQMGAEFVVTVLLFCIASFGPIILNVVFDVDIVQAGAVCMLVFGAGYQILSKEFKAKLDYWLSQKQRDDNRAEMSTIGLCAILLLIVAAAGLAYAVYYLHVDLGAYLYAGIAFLAAAGGTLFALLTGKPKQQPVPLDPVVVEPEKPATIGVSIMQVWDGFRYVENAIINWPQWLEAYGWVNVVIGAVPAGLATVQFTDGRSPYGVYYDKAGNKVYATVDAPMFRKKEPTTEQLYADMLASDNPVQWVIDRYGKAAKDLLAPGYVEGDGWYWQAVENAVKGKDPKQAVGVFCKLTGFEVPVRKD
jgi:hypothetical protein